MRKLSQRVEREDRAVIGATADGRRHADHLGVSHADMYTRSVGGLNA